MKKEEQRLVSEQTEDFYSFIFKMKKIKSRLQKLMRPRRSIKLITDIIIIINNSNNDDNKTNSNADDTRDSKLFLFLCRNKKLDI